MIFTAPPLGGDALPRRLGRGQHALRGAAEAGAAPSSQRSTEPPSSGEAGTHMYTGLSGLDMIRCFSFATS